MGLALAAWLTDRIRVGRKIEQNRQADAERQERLLRDSRLANFAELAFLEVEDWKRAIAQKYTTEQLQARFFRELDEQLAASRLPALTLDERHQWGTWVTLRNKAQRTIMTMSSGNTIPPGNGGNGGKAA